MSSHLPHTRITYAISSETLPELFETSIIIATIDVYHPIENYLICLVYRFLCSMKSIR